MSDKPIIDVDALVHPLHEEIQHHLMQILVMNADLRGIYTHTKELLAQCGCEACQGVLDQIPEDPGGQG